MVFIERYKNKIDFFIKIRTKYNLSTPLFVKTFYLYHQSKLIFLLLYYKNMEYKFLEMLTIDFIASPEDIIRQVFYIIIKKNGFIM